MSDTPNLDQLREYAHRLVGLVDDAHPGLVTWNEALVRVLRSIAEFVDDDPYQPELIPADPVDDVDTGDAL